MKEKGFTLIELLAVIVILAIIALIATPIVLDIIDDTKRSAQLRSAENYLKAAELAVAKKMMDDATFKPTECSIESGNLNCGGTIVDVSVSGEKPDGGILTFGSGSITGVELVLNGKTIIREDGELAFADDEKLDENATDAACFEVEPIYEYEIGASCDAYFQELYDDDEITCNEEVEDYGDLFVSLYDWGFEDITIQELEEAGAITNVKDTNTVSITNYTCGGLEDNEYAIRDVVIPSKINGKTVTKIGEYAFDSYIDEDTSDEEKIVKEKRIINSVKIPNSVVSIGEYAFEYNQLTSVTIGNGVTTIGGRAFYNNQLKSVTIPDSVIDIGYSAFYNNQLASITIGNSVTTIEETAFTENQLKSVVIPDSVITIEKSAFCNNELTSVSIGKGVTTIGGSAFYNNQLKSVTIPDRVIDIGYSAFDSNQLTSVVIKGKSSAAEFENYNPNFGWADGYSDANITWQP